MKDETTSALVATLGGQPQVVTLMLDMLLEQDALIRDVIPIYLPGEDSRSQQGLQKLTREFPGDFYRGRSIHLRPHPVRTDKRSVDDVRDEVDADAVWRTLHTLLGTLKEQGRRIHLCVSGGRRVMGMLACSVAALHFTHHDRIWHIYTSAEFRERANEGAAMHAGPGDDVRLIQVPLMPWGAYFPGVRQLLSASPAEVIASQSKALDRLDQQRCETVLERLTDRQREVLWALADGATPQDVAEALVIEIKTVDSHKTVILAECRVAWDMPEGERLDYRFVREKFGRMNRLRERV